MVVTFAAFYMFIIHPWTRPFFWQHPGVMIGMILTIAMFLAIGVLTIWAFAQAIRLRRV